MLQCMNYRLTMFIMRTVFMLQCMNCRLTMSIMRTVFHAAMHELLSYYVHYENCVSCCNA